MQRFNMLCAVALFLGLSVAPTTHAQQNPPPKKTVHATAMRRPPATPDNFTFKLSLDNGHVGEVVIGCNPKATDAYDRRLDDYAPPPGIGGVAYTFLVPPDRKMNLYQDVRAPATKAKPVQWIFFARINKDPVTVSWRQAAIPKGLKLYCATWDGKSKETGEIQDMHKVSSIKLEKTGYLRVWTDLTDK